jgi:hypothetical protein
MDALPRLERNYRGGSLRTGSAPMVETYTILPTFYDIYDVLSEHNCYGQSKSTYLLYLTVHELYVRDVNGEMQRFRSLIDCGATCLSVAPRPLRRLGLPSEPAYIATFGLDNRVLCQHKIVGKRQSRVCLFVLVLIILYSL